MKPKEVFFLTEEDRFRESYRMSTENRQRFLICLFIATPLILWSLWQLLFH